MNTRRKVSASFVVAMLAFLPQLANACTACMGDPNTNIAKGANAAIFLMLGVLAGMFSLLAAFAFCLYRRAKAPTPPHADLDGFDSHSQQPSLG